MTNIASAVHHNLENTVFVVRSVGERTEQACMASILASGAGKDSIRIVNEAPFSKALERAFETGLDSGRKWTFCVDADMVFRRGAIPRLLARAESLGPTDLGLNSLMLDKFTLSIRTAGPHLYRTNHLSAALGLLDQGSMSIRPETALKHAMRGKGHAWRTLPFVSGVHDFEQRFEDIFRKCHVHANKHLLHLPRLLPLWRELSSQDPDFIVAIEGAAFGIRERQNVQIDKRLRHVNDAWRSLDMQEKLPLSEQVLNSTSVDTLLDSWAAGMVEVHGMRASRDRIIRSNLENDPGAMLALWQDVKALAATKGKVGALAYAAGAMFKRIGNRLQDPVSPARR